MAARNMRWGVRTEYVNIYADEVGGHAVEYVTDSTPEHGWDWLRPVCRRA
ncbi:hypothetical protein O3X23_12100 [Streptomyces sp. H39-S7]|nr:hypothetical protein [Streptomyces sp. H39-S7]